MTLANPGQNLQQFRLQNAKGALDLQLGANGFVLSGIISSNQAVPIFAGELLKLDPAALGPIPQFIAAGPSDTNTFFLVSEVKQNSFSAGDPCQAAGVGTVMVLLANAAINPGQDVEYVAATTPGTTDNGAVQVKSANLKVGVNLDPATTGTLTRVMIGNNTAS